jgi:hypothetical protein
MNVIVKLIELVRTIGINRGDELLNGIASNGEVVANLKTWGWDDVEVAYRADDNGHVYGAITVDEAGVGAEIYDLALGYSDGRLTELRVYLNDQLAL